MIQEIFLNLTNCATGIAYGAWKTQGFKKPIEFREVD